jgi:hypothetical protein
MLWRRLWNLSFKLIIIIIFTVIDEFSDKGETEPYLIRNQPGKINNKNLINFNFV